MPNGEDNKNSLERYLGTTIRELRQRHGLTIAQVCEPHRQPSPAGFFVPATDYPGTGAN